MKKPERPENKALRRHDKPAMQGSFRERVKMIKPYKDVVDQVEQNFHGKGGLKRYNDTIANQRKHGQRKPLPPSALDKLALRLAKSRCTQVAKSKLTTPHDWPKYKAAVPEVAFIGRSNVGKSSLLNQISEFGSVASVSPMPGKTKHVSWYRNTTMSIDIIDMPGYGHSDRARVFGPSALEFVKQRTTLSALYVLIDARHGFKRSDHEWLGELGKEGPMKQVILTKCDLVSPKELIKIASLARSDLEGFKRVEHKVLLASTIWHSGLHDVRCDILRRCGRDPDRPSPREESFQPTSGLSSRGVTDRRLDVAPGRPAGRRGLSLPGTTDRDWRQRTARSERM